MNINVFTFQESADRVRTKKKSSSFSLEQYPLREEKVFLSVET